MVLWQRGRQEGSDSWAPWRDGRQEGADWWHHGGRAGSCLVLLWSPTRLCPTVPGRQWQRDVNAVGSDGHRDGAIGGAARRGRGVRPRPSPRPPPHPPGPPHLSPAPHRSLYLDYNATTPLAPEVAQAVGDAMCQAWGNASSSHPAGRGLGELPCWLPAARAGPSGHSSPWWSCQVSSRRQEGEGAHQQCPGEPGEDGGRPAGGHCLYLRGHRGGISHHLSAGH